jgi:diacylglycerol kinase (ATP)
MAAKTAFKPTVRGRWSRRLSGLARLGRSWLGRPGKPEHGERHEGSQGDAEERTREHVERVVHAEIDPRQGDRGRDAESVGTRAGADDGDGGSGGESRSSVTGGERGVVGDRDQRLEARLGVGWAGTPEQILDRGDGERRSERGDSSGEEGERRPPAPEVAAQAEADQEQTLHPPGGEQDEESRRHGLLQGGSGADHGLIDLDELGEHRAREANRARPLLVVNGRASGIDDPGRTATELKSILDELNASAEATITSNEADLFEALRGAVATRRRVILVGGDGSLHDAANAALGKLPELALVPAGRANNIARALGVPPDRPRALAIAALAPARPLDVLRVETPERTMFAVEGVSAGFQAQARSGYEAENSSDLRQGVQALIQAVRRFTPFELRARINGQEVSSDAAAQLFLSNLPFFGFGFQVDPGADPADGRLEAIIFEASARRTLLRLGAAAYRGRHLGRTGVRRFSTPYAELVEPLPLVADAEPLGTTTATVSVEPERLRVAVPAGRSR